MAEDKKENENEKDQKEFATEQLMAGTPQGNISLMVFLANILDKPVDELKLEFDKAQQLVREAFASL